MYWFDALALLLIICAVVLSLFSPLPYFTFSTIGETSLGIVIVSRMVLFFVLAGNYYIFAHQPIVAFWEGFQEGQQT
jgi:hypothetical protein